MYVNERFFLMLSTDVFFSLCFLLKLFLFNINSFSIAKCGWMHGLIPRSPGNEVTDY